MNRKFFAIVGVLAFALLTGAPSWGQSNVSDRARAQMASVTSAKASLTPAQKKMGLNLVFGAMAAVDDPRVSSFRGAIVESLNSRRPAPVPDWRS